MIDVVVAPNEAFDRDLDTVARVREWLESIESVESNPRMRGASRRLAFESDEIRRRDIRELRRRLDRLHELFPELAGVTLAEAVERAAAQLSAEVT